MTNREQKYDIRQLADKWLAGQLSREEEVFFQNWYRSFDDRTVFVEGSSYHRTEDMKEAIYRKLIDEIASLEENRKEVPMRRRYVRLWLTGAAVLALTAGLILWQVYRNPQHKNGFVDIEPGRNKATLLLADGRVIPLSESHDGIVIQTERLVYDDGTLIDKQLELPIDQQDKWNTIVTPRGGQYKLILPDGSTVWLNAASSLRYPSSFSKHKRMVFLVGEAYFDIARQSEAPFEVETAHHKIEVLGTQFNVNTYDRKSAVTTTLLEGSIKVSSLKQKNARMLMPGQQAVQEGEDIAISQVNAELAIAWKNGFFTFDDESLEEIMSKISRWYDVEVSYQSGVNKGLAFGGTVSKYEKVSSVLEKIELTGGVTFKMEGRRILVMK